MASSDYSSEQSILIVGDGNFTFSLSLAKQLAPLQKPFVCSTNHSFGYVRSKFHGVSDTIKSLRDTDQNIEIKYNVDALDLSAKFNVSKWSHSFDRIIWNFPIAQSTESIVENQRLILNFLASASPFLHAKGEIHLRLCNYQPEDWQIGDLLNQTCLKVISVDLFRETDFPGYKRVCDTKDEEWEIYPQSARTFRIGARGDQLDEEEATRRLLFLRWKMVKSALHSECTTSDSKKRKIEETVCLPSISYETEQFLNQQKNRSETIHVYHHFEPQQQAHSERSERYDNPYVPFVQRLVQNEDFSNRYLDAPPSQQSHLY